MRYFKLEVKSDDSFRSTYYAEIDNLIGPAELNEYVYQIAAIDMLEMDDEGEELEVSKTIELSEDEMYDIIFSGNVRTKLVISALNDLSNTVLGIYRIEKNFRIEDEQCYIFSAAAGQDSDVTSIGKTSKDKPREQVIQEGWNDCVGQLKRYFQIPGVVMATGLFTIQAISNEEYDMEVAERELVLV